MQPLIGGIGIRNDAQRADQEKYAAVQAARVGLGVKQWRLAKLYGVDPSNISHINRGSTWVHKEAVL